MNIQDIVKKIIQKITTNETEGLSEEKILEFEKEINWHLPAEYREILKSVDGGYGEVGNNYIDFWNIDDIGFYIEDVNDNDLDELILFASDGCGIAFAFDKRNNEILSIPMDCLERSCAKTIANSFSEFIQKLDSQKLEY